MCKSSKKLTETIQTEQTWYVFMQFFWQDHFIKKNISPLTDVFRSHSLTIVQSKWSKTQLPSCFATNSNRESSLQDCDMKSVQSNTSVAIVWKWIAHNRHQTGISIDIYWYNMCHLTKHAWSFSKAFIFTVHITTQKQRFQIYPLWRVFSLTKTPSQCGWKAKT